MALRTVHSGGGGDYTTVQAATTACATSGDEVQFLDSASYNEAVDARGGGGWGKAILFTVAPGQTPTMSGAGAKDYAFKLGTMQVPAAGVLTKFLGLKFSAYDQTGAGKAAIYGNGGQCELYDCEFASCLGTAVVDVTPSATLPFVMERCKQTGTAGGSLINYQVAGAPGYCNLRSNLANCATGVVGVRIGGTASTVYNNTVVVRTAQAIAANNAGVDIRNNLCRNVNNDNPTAAIYSGGTHQYNCLSGFSTTFSPAAAGGTGEFLPFTMTADASALTVGETLKKDNGAGATIGTLLSVSGTVITISPASSGFVPIAGTVVYGVTSTATRTVSAQTPLFTDEAGGDFTIPASSLAIDAGTTIGAVVDDLLGVARPQGAAYDMGAYERVLAVNIVDVTVLSSTSIRINLSGAAATDASWSDVGNYTITSSDGGAIPAISAAASTGNPSSVITLTTGEHTDGRTYDVAVSGVTLVNDGSAGYTGAGVAPTIASVTPQSATVTRVVFSEAMTANAELTDPTNYVFAAVGTPPGGFVPTATSVAVVNGTTVDVTHSLASAGWTYELTVTGPEDAALNPCADAETYAAWGTSAIVDVTVESLTSILVRTNGVQASADVEDADDWTVTVEVGPAASVAVVSAVLVEDDTKIRIALWPGLTPGATYRATGANV